MNGSSLRLPDGRRLAYAEFGAPDGAPVFYLHGLMSSRLEAAIGADEALRSGLRLIAVDRPGCGGSDPLPGRTLLDWPRDIAALADALACPRFHVMGISGGGPYALAVAHALPSRVSSLALVCALGPPESLALLAAGPGTGLFSFAGRWPKVARGLLAPLAWWLRRSPIGFVERVMAGASAADRMALSEPPVRAHFARALREGVRQGMRGALADAALYARDWGFALAEVDAPATLWQGEDDHTVPPDVARLLVAGLPQCTAHYLPGEGHFSLPIRHLGQILAALRALA
ncbi:alpha/beta fold hydrolase [Acidihalobacter ferrooxydans]|uniref:AB hydrolase-1 domain-containing protein n=1 Tax=Acidihalobacter ferrooxydans TaxID=1765967 RepID=A0A1P8UK05_9GAMM|nr:alpha/beta hydrolase [Acidihalobacter ferrooxydans]APZ44160.1 hypothetical protein BW247_14540 [Acidihalobacter ferrooxydans]